MQKNTWYCFSWSSYRELWAYYWEDTGWSSYIFVSGYIIYEWYYHPVECFVILFYIFIVVPPVITDSDIVTPLEVLVNDSITIQCDTEGIPRPTVIRLSNALDTKLNPDWTWVMAFIHFGQGCLQPGRRGGQPKRNLSFRPKIFKSLLTIMYEFLGSSPKLPKRSGLGDSPGYVECRLLLTTAEKFQLAKVNLTWSRHFVWPKISTDLVKAVGICNKWVRVGCFKPKMCCLKILKLICTYAKNFERQFISMIFPMRSHPIKTHIYSISFKDRLVWFGRSHTPWSHCLYNYSIYL